MKVTMNTAKEIKETLNKMTMEGEWGKISEFAKNIEENLEYPKDDIRMQIEYHRIMNTISPFIATDVETQWQIVTFAIEQLNQLSSNPEDDHKEADTILLEVIERLAPCFGAQIRRAFDDIGKWYC